MTTALQIAFYELPTMSYLIVIGIAIIVIVIAATIVTVPASRAIIIIVIVIIAIAVIIIGIGIVIIGIDVGTIIVGVVIIAIRIRVCVIGIVVITIRIRVYIVGIIIVAVGIDIIVTKLGQIRQVCCTWGFDAGDAQRSIQIHSSLDLNGVTSLKWSITNHGRVNGQGLTVDSPFVAIHSFNHSGKSHFDSLNFLRCLATSWLLSRLEGTAAGAEQVSYQQDHCSKKELLFH
jgi:hypothetical protein